MSRLAIIALATALSTTAHAQWYAGAGIGVATTRAGGSTGALSLSAHETHNVGLKIMGGYQINPVFGIEAQYADLGRFGYSACAGGACNTGHARADQWSLAGTVTVPFGNNYFGFAKLGATRNQVRNGQACAGATCADLSGSRGDLLGGLGVGYRFNANLAMRVEYEHFGRLTSRDGLAARGDHWAASIVYSF